MTLRVRQPVSLGDGGSAGTGGRRPVSASWRDNPRSGLRDRDRRAEDVGREEINQVMQSSGPKQAAVVPVDGTPGSGWGASSVRSAAGGQCQIGTLLLVLEFPRGLRDLRRGSVMGLVFYCLWLRRGSIGTGLRVGCTAHVLEGRQRRMNTNG